MPVILDPKPQKSVQKEVVCRDGCGALIGYIPNDVRSEWRKDYGGGSDEYRWILCPQCSKKILVK